MSAKRDSSIKQPRPVAVHSGTTATVLALETPKPTVEITPETPFTVAEFSSLFGFPAAAIIEAIRRQRSALSKAFYTIPDLAARWNCSRAKVYNILRESEFEVLDLSAQNKDRGGKGIPAAVVEKLEAGRMKKVA